MEMFIIFLILLIIILVVLVSCVRIVPQANALVVERLGAYLRSEERRVGKECRL